MPVLSDMGISAVIVNAGTSLESFLSPFCDIRRG